MLTSVDRSRRPRAGLPGVAAGGRFGLIRPGCRAWAGVIVDEVMTRALARQSRERQRCLRTEPAAIAFAAAALRDTAVRARCRTRCTHFVRSAQTPATSRFTKRVGPRAAPTTAPLRRRLLMPASSARALGFVDLAEHPREALTSALAKAPAALLRRAGIWMLGR